MRATTHVRPLPARKRRFPSPGELLSPAGGDPWGWFCGLALLLLAASCAEEPHPRADNERPFVRIETRVDAGGRLPHITRFLWTGWDTDGVIDHYQYAVDIPDSLSLDQINDPDGRFVTWTNTTATRMDLAFAAAEPETLRDGEGRIVITGLALRSHTLHVRSVDNEGAVSLADYLAFTAENVLPKTTLSPACFDGSTIPGYGNHFEIHWSGQDPDGPVPGGRPVASEWKVFPVPIYIVDPGVQYLVTVSPGPRYPWVPVPGDNTSLVLSDLEPGPRYLFAIRAIDEAGGAENIFHEGQNAAYLSFQYLLDPPPLEVREPLLGRHLFPTDGPIFETDVPVGVRLTFEAALLLPSRCGVTVEYEWTLDSPDIRLRSPALGPTLTFTLSTPGLHTLAVESRVLVEGEVVLRTMGILRLNAVVVARPGGRDVLYLDDFLNRPPGGAGGTDSQTDQRIEESLRAAGFRTINRFDVFDANDVSTIPRLIRFSDLADYKLLVWNTWGAKGTPSGSVGLVAAADCGIAGRPLQLFVEAGGGVLIFGQQVVNALKKPVTSGSCVANLRSDGLNFVPGDFACDFLRFCDADVRTVVNDRNNSLIGVEATAEAAQDLFPPLEVDSTLWDVSILGGIQFINGIFHPIVHADLDTLYRIRTLVTEQSFDRRPAGFRIVDRDPIPVRGPVFLYGFPLHVLKQGDAGQGTGVRGMFRALGCWLGRNSGLDLNLDPECPVPGTPSS